jgi:hypothetical protein
MIQHPPRRYFRIAPNGRVERVLDYRGRMTLPERPEWLLCDYCCVRADQLFYRVARHFVALLDNGRCGEFERSGWGACRQCRPLVDARDWRALAARASMCLDIPGETLEHTYRCLMLAFEDIPEYRWESGRPRPATPEPRA